MINEKIADHLQIGKLGEDIACRFLENKGFSIIERNYTKQYGEIDIVAKKDQEFHFVEVKSVSREINSDGVIRETSFSPEDAIQFWKIENMKKVISAYILEKELLDAEWYFDVVAVFIDLDKKTSKVRFRENMTL